MNKLGLGVFPPSTREEEQDARTRGEMQGTAVDNVIFSHAPYHSLRDIEIALKMQTQWKNRTLSASSQEFGGRAQQLVSFVAGSNVDDNGHGTHVAGIIGSWTYGVAKRVRIFGVKVTDHNSNSPARNLLAALDFVQQNAPGHHQRCFRGFVVNISLGSPLSASVNDATTALVDAGFFTTVAAGNQNRDAAGFSPASASRVCTVGGTSQDDIRYRLSNFGPLIRINAPALGIMSTLPNNRSGFMSGTSMAAPFVAGLAAYLAAYFDTRAGPDLCESIVDVATRDAIRNPAPNTVNNIANNANNRAGP